MDTTNDMESKCKPDEDAIQSQLDVPVLLERPSPTPAPSDIFPIDQVPGEQSRYLTGLKVCSTFI